MKRTFSDAGVLIWFTRDHDEPRCRAAREVLEDPEREFLTSPFLKAELLPHALRSRKQPEVVALERYFSLCECVSDLGEILAMAETVLRARPMGLADALHVSAAHLLGADEFVTTEAGKKSARAAALFDNPFVRVITLRPRR
jgi:predicted nucleic acid-binding protein